MVLARAFGLGWDLLERVVGRPLEVAVEVEQVRLMWTRN
jgi:hypothetical protein